jgi:hypothetical protein
MDGTITETGPTIERAETKKAIVDDRKLPGTSPSTIVDAIVLMTISDPMRRRMRITS